MGNGGGGGRTNAQRTKSHRKNGRTIQDKCSSDSQKLSGQKLTLRTKARRKQFLDLNVPSIAQSNVASSSSPATDASSRVGTADSKHVPNSHCATTVIVPQQAGRTFLTGSGRAG